MLKHLMSGASLLAIALRDGADTGADEKTKLREQLAKGNTPAAEIVPPVKDEEGDDKDGEEDKETEEGENEEADDDEKVEETAEEKAAREASETAEAKEKRKEERIQKRIDKAVAAQRVAEAEVLKLKEQLAAKPPEEKLTEAEVQARAEAIANEKLTTQNLANLQKEFTKNCDIIQEAAEKIDAKFYPKVQALAAEIGPLPTPMLNELFELENGADILVYLANDVDEAERIYDLVSTPTKLGRELGKLSDKLAEAKKPKPKELSKVPDAVKPVNGNRVQSTAITTKDTTPEGMENYVRKRQLQIKQRKEQGR